MAITGSSDEICAANAIAKGTSIRGSFLDMPITQRGLKNWGKEILKDFEGK